MEHDGVNENGNGQGRQRCEPVLPDEREGRADSAAGHKLEFTPSTLPILPGETRAIPLTLHLEREERVAIQYPVTISGKLEWGDRTTAFEQTFTR